MLLLLLLLLPLLLLLLLLKILLLPHPGTDPDSAAIPYLTALGDLLGGGLLATAFLVLGLLGQVLLLPGVLVTQYCNLV